MKRSGKMHVTRGLVRRELEQRFEDVAGEAHKPASTTKLLLDAVDRVTPPAADDVVDERPRNADGEAIHIATAPSQRIAKRRVRAKERKRLEELVAKGIRCSCAHARLQMAPAPAAAVTCPHCGVWLEDGKASFPNKKARKT